MKNLVIFFAFSFTITSCTFLNTPAPSIQDLTSPRNAEPGMPSKPGACFAKALIPDMFITEIQEFAVYTGLENEQGLALDTIEWETAPERTEWQKKRADKNCLSDNPEDCLVWCLVNVPAEIKTLVVVLDTTQTENYELIEENRKELAEAGAYTEWKEVLCENQITPGIVTQLQEALYSRGYFSSTISGKYTNPTRDALSNFQKANGLPIGQLDFETLEALEVEF